MATGLDILLSTKRPLPNEPEPKSVTLSSSLFSPRLFKRPRRFQQIVPSSAPKQVNDKSKDHLSDNDSNISEPHSSDDEDDDYLLDEDKDKDAELSDSASMDSLSESSEEVSEQSEIDGSMSNGSE